MQSILAQVKIWTILVALAGFFVLWPVVSLSFAAGVLVSALWAVAGLWVLEGLLRSGLVPPGKQRNLFALFLWGFAKLIIYGLALWVLLSRAFPITSHAVGFTILMAVLVVVGARSRSEDIRLSTPQGDNTRVE